MTELYIENEQDEIEIDGELEKLISDCVDAVLQYEGFSKPCEVSVLIVGNDEIRRLNCEHRQKDAVTDVLSFPILEFDGEGNILNDEFDLDGESVLLGDIVICAPRAAEQAAEFGHSFKREIAFLTVHSMLHLLGYDHEHSEDEEQDMFLRQRSVLDKMGIKRREQDS